MYFILIFFVFAISSCRSKKTFNGTAELPCPDHDGVNIEEDKKSKWRLVLYKDGRSVFGKKSSTDQFPPPLNLSLPS